MHILQIVAALAGVAFAAAIAQSDTSSADLGRRTGRVYKVKDLTGPNLTGRFQVGYTDLGIPARTPDGRLIFICGDTFADRVGGANWRAPVGLYSSNSNLDHVVIDDAVGGSSAVGLVPEGHRGGTTAIPSDVFAANGKLYMNLMRGVIYKTVGPFRLLGKQRQWKDLAVPVPLGSCDVGDDGYLYCLATVFNRDRVSDLLLHRVPVGSIENARAWQPWGYKNGAWGWGNPPTTIARSRRWGEISWRNLGKGKWVFTWLNMEPLGIHYMVLNGPTDNLFAAREQVLILPAANLGSEHDNYVASPYGGFIFPGSTLNKFDFAVSQWNGNTYRVMQFRAEGL
ncbi:hypothetical protein QQS21_004178 [Conoideocrella luteorostrata]|uniref:DUF4185 domain-containing protein n=1 Tax=Conoideocrella luteorostrata TaxID=1105319 RepID=A0AAJ0FZZ2_9HYPO|nr:hypothetical protein QQS21_004178 [Conoideocrella luteorostrata]